MRKKGTNTNHQQDNRGDTPSPPPPRSLPPDDREGVREIFGALKAPPALLKAEPLANVLLHGHGALRGLEALGGDAVHAQELACFVWWFGGRLGVSK